MAAYQRLPCGTILFRAILHKDWIRDANQIDWLAFQLRKEDKGKVSLFTTIEAIQEELPKPTYGNISVHVGRVRDISVDGDKLDVEQDRDVHVSIVGMPDFWIEEDDKRKRKVLKNKVKNFCEDIAEKASRIHNLSELYLKNE